MNRLDYLIQRYLERTETKEELEELTALVVSERYRHVIEDTFAEAVRARLLDMGHPVDPALQQSLAEIRNRINLSKPKGIGITPVERFPWFKVAAAVLLLLVASAALWISKPSLFQGKDVAAHSVRSSGTQKILLQDGSIVWLKGNSTLTYPKAFSGSTRAVSLVGEALFEVAKDASHPFIIECGDLTTTVLGTSFNIRSGHSHTEIVVLTGKVSVQSKIEEKTTIILPNEKAVYNHVQKALIKSAAAADESVAIIDGTEYSMSFEDTPMKEVVKRIEDKFGVEVVMADARLGNCMITADLTDQSLDLALEMISKSLRTSYTINNGHVLLHGPGCH
jgi:ferric-dicitrate binding protein FerR (iron transport regulator)